jgi:hypothetical protein
MLNFGKAKVILQERQLMAWAAMIRRMRSGIWSQRGRGR